MHLQQRLRGITYGALIGIVLSLLLTFQYYQEEPRTWCLLALSFPCTLVESPYATVGGIFYFLAIDLGWNIQLLTLPIPNSIFFLVLFLFVFLIAAHVIAHKSVYSMPPRTAILVAKTLLYLGGVYAIYLTYVETYLLYSFCLLCAATTLTLFTLLWLSIGIHVKIPYSRHQRKKRHRSHA